MKELDLRVEENRGMECPAMQVFEPLIRNIFMKVERYKDFKEYFRVFMSYTVVLLNMQMNSESCRARQIRKRDLASPSDRISSMSDHVLDLRVWISVSPSVPYAHGTQKAE